MCTDMGSETNELTVLYGSVLACKKAEFYANAFLHENKSPLIHLFTDVWLLTLLYQVDLSIFRLTEFEIARQHNFVFRNWKHVLAFHKSLELWLVQLR